MVNRYMRLLAQNSQMHVLFTRVMPFKNAPGPQSLFTDNGMMNTYMKSDFLHKLGGNYDGIHQDSTGNLTYTHY